MSPLFSRLPAEIRRLIWEFVLADYEEQAHVSKYSPMTYYTRPS